MNVAKQKVLARCSTVPANIPSCVCETIRELHTHLPGYGQQAPRMNAVFKYNREMRTYLVWGLNLSQKENVIKKKHV